MLKRVQAAALGLAAFTAPALACDKPAANERIMQFVAKGEIQRPTRVSEGFAVEVAEKFWAAADAKQKEALAGDVACSVGTNTVSFTKDRSVLQTFQNKKQ
jgi:hypothetical protein